MQPPADEFGAFGHRQQAVTTCRLTTHRLLEGIETYSVINDLKPGGVAVHCERQPGHRGIGVLDYVLQALLRDAVERQLDVLGQAGVDEVDLDTDLGDRPCETGEPAGQAQILEHGRAKPADGGAGLL